MNTFLICLLLTSCMLPGKTNGRGSQYANGVMDRVISYRQSRDELPSDLSFCQAFIAVRECGDIGKVFAIRPPSRFKIEGEWEIACAVDCASKSDCQSDTDPRSGYEWMVTEGIIFEVDSNTARRWGYLGEIIPHVEMVNLGLSTWEIGDLHEDLFDHIEEVLELHFEK